jgi:glycyl-tRNA synthetase alpha chain
MSKYYFEIADVDRLWRQFDDQEEESHRCLDEGLVLPAYECALHCSHLFNVLDARGAISVTERVGLIGRIRDLAVGCAKQYVERRRELGFPLLDAAASGAAAGGGEDG